MFCFFRGQRGGRGEQKNGLLGGFFSGIWPVDGCDSRGRFDEKYSLLMARYALRGLGILVDRRRFYLFCFVCFGH